MAVFDPVVSPTQDPNFTRDSQGVRPEDNLRQRGLEEATIKPKGVSQSDESQGMLYKSIGQGISGAAGLIDFAGKAVDTLLKDSIDKRLTAELDAQQGRYTAQLAGYYNTPAAAAKTPAGAQVYTGGEGPASGSPAGLPFQATETPKEVLNDLPDQLDVILAARDNGKMSPTFYYAKLNEIAKSYRMQYPGQRDTIDKIVAARTGVHPANALITSITADLNAASDNLKHERDKVENLLRSDIGIPDADEKLIQFRHGLISADDVYRYVAKYKNAEYYFKMQGLKRDHEKGGREDQAISDGKDFDFKATMTVSNAIDNIAVPAGFDGPPAKIYDFLNDVNNGKVPRPDSTRLQVIGAALQRGRDQIASELTDHAYKNGYGKTLGGKEIKDRVDQYLANYDRITGHILKQEYGEAFYASRMVKAKGDDNISQFLSEESIAASNMVSQGLRHVGGDQYMAQIASDQIGKGIIPKIDALMKTYGDKIRLQPTLPSSAGFNPAYQKYDPTKTPGTPYTFYDQLTKMKEKGVADPKAYDYLVGMIDKELVNPATPDAVKLNIATAAFASPDGKSLIDVPWVDKNGNSRRGEIYNRVTNEDVRNTIFELGKKNPAIWNNYTNFVEKSFNSLFRDDVMSLNDVTSNPRVQLAWNSSATKFRLLVDGQDVTERSLKNTVRPAIPEGWLTKTQQVVNRVNFGLGSVRGVAEKVSGFDTEAYLLNSMLDMGLDPNRRGISQNMPDAFLNAVMSSRVRAKIAEEDKKKKWQAP